ncbi:MAG: DNA repair protein RecO [Bacteroidales bacterium]|nr:DNA repair protein RecO [Bacteroidales bacterium]
MLVSIKGIVLHTLKYTDSGIIAHIYTQQYGLLSFIIKGINNKKGSTRKVFFQPLQILDLEIYYRENRDLHSIKEVSPAYTFSQISVNVSRSSIAFFVGEVLYKAIHESESNQQLYDFIYDSVLYLDDSNNATTNFHIGFLVGLSKYLGISPLREKDQNNHYFDMQEGIFTSRPPLHGYYFDKYFSHLLDIFLRSDMNECNLIPLSGKQRASFLENLLTYFSMHLPGLKSVKSLKVFSEVFD